MASGSAGSRPRQPLTHDGDGDPLATAEGDGECEGDADGVGAGVTGAVAGADAAGVEGEAVPGVAQATTRAAMSAMPIVPRCDR